MEEGDWMMPTALWLVGAKSPTNPSYQLLCSECRGGNMESSGEIAGDSHSSWAQGRFPNLPPWHSSGLKRAWGHKWPKTGTDRLGVAKGSHSVEAFTGPFFFLSVTSLPGLEHQPAEAPHVQLHALFCISVSVEKLSLMTLAGSSTNLVRISYIVIERKKKVTAYILTRIT